MTAPTSVAAYHNVARPQIPTLHSKILALLGYGAEYTTSELADKLGRPRDSISPRMAELLRCGAIEQNGTREDPATFTEVIVWRATGKPYEPSKRGPSVAEANAQRGAETIARLIQRYEQQGLKFLPKSHERLMCEQSCAALRSLRYDLEQLGVITKIEMPGVV